MSPPLHHLVTALLVVLNTDPRLYKEWSSPECLGTKFGLFTEDAIDISEEKFRGDVRRFLECSTFAFIEAARKDIGSDDCSVLEMVRWIQNEFPELSKMAPQIQSLYLGSLNTR